MNGKQLSVFLFPKHTQHVFLQLKRKGKTQHQTNMAIKEISYINQNELYVVNPFYHIPGVINMGKKNILQYFCFGV